MLFFAAAALLATTGSDLDECRSGDATACLHAGYEATSHHAAAQLFERSCTLGNGDGCFEAAALSDDTARQMLLRHLGEKLKAGARDAPPSAPPATVTREPESPPSPGERWGLIGIANVKIGTGGASALAGGGIRLGLRQRTPEPLMFMPALAVLGGIEYGMHEERAGWLESRLELMGTRPSGLLLPRIHGYVSAGARIAQTYYAPLTEIGSRIAVRPYFSIGGGWNWLPDQNTKLDLSWLSGSGQGAAAVAIAFILVLPLIFAGRLEFRVMPAMNGKESTELAVVTGFGF